MPYDPNVVVKSSGQCAEFQPFVISNANSRPDAAAVQAIINAIQALNASAGVVFSPFSLKCAAGTFNNIWNSDRGDTPITFFQSNGTGGANNAGDFLPLGDYAMIGSYDPNSYPTAPGTQILFAPAEDASVLAHPMGFSWILNDHGSGNPRNVDYFTINPPPGYTALGIAFNNGGGSPDPTKYWCVRNDLVRSVGASNFWSDKGQHWTSHNGDLLVPIANFPVPEPTMLFAPPTFLSAEGGTLAYAVVMQQADLQVTPFDATLPTYDPTITSGDETSYGVTSVKIVPYTVVPDPGYPAQSTNSPFYFIAAEPYWLCTIVLPTPKGGSFTVTQTIGTDQTDSNGFSTETSLTVSADVGASYGPASASVSTSYTQAFGTTVDHTVSHSTEVQTQIALNLPEQPRTWIWERQTQIAVFRSDATQLTPAVYSEPDMMFIPAGSEK